MGHLQATFPKPTVEGTTKSSTHRAYGCFPRFAASKRGIYTTTLLNY